MLNKENLAKAIELIRDNNNEEISLSAFLKLLTPILKESYISVETKDIRSWLFSQGYLRYDNLPSELGYRVGLMQSSFEINKGEITRKYLACNLVAQELILNNLNDIYAPIEQAKEAEKAEKEKQKAEEKARRDAEKAAKKAQALVERKEAIKTALLDKAETFQPSENSVSLSALIRAFNVALDLQPEHKLVLGDVKPLILEMGIIELNAENRMVPTVQGINEGVVLKQGQNEDGSTFEFPIYDAKVQKKILIYLVQKLTR